MNKIVALMDGDIAMKAHVLEGTPEQMAVELEELQLQARNTTDGNLEWEEIYPPNPTDGLKEKLAESRLMWMESYQIEKARSIALERALHEVLEDVHCGLLKDVTEERILENIQGAYSAAQERRKAFQARYRIAK